MPETGPLAPFAPPALRLPRTVGGGLTKDERAALADAKDQRKDELADALIKASRDRDQGEGAESATQQDEAA